MVRKFEYRTRRKKEKRERGRCKKKMKKRFTGYIVFVF